MIDYNPKEWFSFIFRFHKADTLRKLAPLILSVCVYTAGVVVLEKEILQLSDTNSLKNIPVMHSILGLVISLLLVFRTNTAYDRWWEGRRQWGSLVNNSRNLALKMQSILRHQHPNNANFYKTLIPAFASSLRHHLRNRPTDLKDLEPFGISINTDKPHYPNLIAFHLMDRTYNLNQKGFISGDQLITLNAELQSLSDICGACERIKKTPIPFSYSVFLKKFIFFYVMTLPFGFVFTVGYWTIPVVAFILYVLASLELIAEEIEDPFGTDANDIPTDQLADTIEKNVKEIFESFMSTEKPA